MKRIGLIAVTWVFGWIITGCAVMETKKVEPLKPSAEELNIIPKPASVAVYEKKLILPDEIFIVAVTPEEKEHVALVRDLFEGLGVTPRDSDSNVDGSINITLKSHRSSNQLGKEGYTLEISESGVEIVADGGAGLFYGIQSLAQILPLNESAPVVLPYLRIIDHPEYRWRGLHLDVSRHFFSVSFVKKFIDQMARYKLNTLHWHLTDDQGWRIEIKKYPKLTTVGSVRKETMVKKNFKPYVGDGRKHSGYYTQREIGDIVSYAKKRHVNVVPEIEMPGHATAALAAYPEYSCTGGPIEVSTVWGIAGEVFCPTEETFQFLNDVLDEVIALFPSPYIHIGADEVVKTQWKESPFCQDLMKKEGLENEAQLQSYFVERIEKHLLSKKRKMIGWDEILEGGKLSKTAVVMSWRGEIPGIQASELGHDVVMSPTTTMYFDYYQGDRSQEPLAIGGYLPLKKVYDYHPVSSKIKPENRHHILGVQANVWTEYISTESHVEYMVYPRALALAEVAWTPRHVKNWESFQSRLATHYARLDKDGVNYRLSEPEGLESDRIVGADTIEINLLSHVENGEIRYTLDGSAPTNQSHLYAGPVVLDLAKTREQRVNAIAIGPSGKQSIVSSALFRSLDPEISIKGDLLSGIRLKKIDGEFTSLDALVGTASHQAGIVTTGFRLPSKRILGTNSHFGLMYQGYIEIKADGKYGFELDTQGGNARLNVGDEVLEGRGTLEVDLNAGWIPIQLLFSNHSENYKMNLTCEGFKKKNRKLPSELLWHEVEVKR